MKKLFFILISIFFSVSVFSQVGVTNLRVTNDTNCIQYFVVLGGDDCQCMAVTRSCHSDLISIPANSTKVLNGSNLGGVNEDSKFRKTDFIFCVRIAEGPMDVGCFAGGTVGQLDCGAPSFSYVYNAKIKKCELCKENPKTLATWKPGFCEEYTAELIFTNL